MTQKKVVAYTDGSCLGNPGPGGWAALMRCGEHEKELVGGNARTTNNRMEMMAVIAALEALIEPCVVLVVTDSQYVCHAIEKKWLVNWQKKGWKTADKKPVKNRDLWERMVPLLAHHTVRFTWVRGHAGHPENERCDVLAREFAARPGLEPDAGFVSE